jgi:hypothetical protein
MSLISILKIKALENCRFDRFSEAILLLFAALCVCVCVGAKPKTISHFTFQQKEFDFIFPFYLISIELDWIFFGFITEFSFMEVERKVCLNRTAFLIHKTEALIHFQVFRQFSRIFFRLRVFRRRDLEPQKRFTSKGMA